MGNHLGSTIGVPEIDADAARVLQAMRAAARPPLESLSPPQARAAFRAMREAMKQVVPEMAEVRNLAAIGPAGPIPLRLYRSRSASVQGAPCMIFFHGGGWVVGDLETHDIQCRAFADAMAGVVIAVDYRLAPEHKFPAAIDDAFAAVDWIATNAAALGIDPLRLALGGDSAGGNLAAVAALTRVSGASRRIRAQVLIYPVVDLQMKYDSYARVGEGYTLTLASMLWFREHYLTSLDQAEDWRASPLFAQNLADAPPAYVVTAGLDPLCDEGDVYAQALRKAGVGVQFRCCTGQMHGFVGAGGVIAQADMVIAEIGEFLKSRLV